jgi:acyl-phosphate glycerol 3-phosphate acyltransferase
MEIVLATLLSYAIGSAPIVYLIARAKGIDLRQSGTGNLGSGNLWAQAGNWAGSLGVVVDLTKGPAAVLLTRALELGIGAEAVSVTAVVAGQMWPATLGFQGGRGNITAAGGLIALSPIVGILALVPVIMLTAQNLLSVISRRAHIARTKSSATPVAAIAGLTGFALIGVASGDMAAAAAGTAVTTLILVRRLTAPWPKDPVTGHAPERSLTSILLFDRPLTVKEPSSGQAGDHGRR